MPAAKTVDLGRHDSLADQGRLLRLSNSGGPGSPGVNPSPPKADAIGEADPTAAFHPSARAGQKQRGKKSLHLKSELFNPARADPVGHKARTAGQDRGASTGTVLAGAGLSLTWAGRGAATGLADAASGAGRGQTPRVFRGGWPRWLCRATEHRSRIVTVAEKARRASCSCGGPRVQPERFPIERHGDSSFPGRRPSAGVFSANRSGHPGFPTRRFNRQRNRASRAVLRPGERPLSFAPPRRAGASAFRAQRWPSPFGGTTGRGWFPIRYAGSASFLPRVAGSGFPGGGVHPSRRDDDGAGRGPAARGFLMLSALITVVVTTRAVFHCGGAAVITGTDSCPGKWTADPLTRPSATFSPRGAREKDHVSFDGRRRCSPVN
jgi:hypothetical protein